MIDVILIALLLAHFGELYILLSICQGIRELKQPTQLPTSIPSAAAHHSLGGISVVKKIGDDWVHIGHRVPGHPDIDEALRTVGLAVRHEDGSIQETY